MPLEASGPHLLNVGLTRHRPMVMLHLERLVHILVRGLVSRVFDERHASLTSCGSEVRGRSVEVV